MKIYTYYEDIDFDEQDKLIELWKISWSHQGYEPIVLNLEDAKKHPYFETLNTEMRRIYKEITNNEISEYGMSCWFRWLAYATEPDEKFYVSDYDAINVNFPVTEPNDKLHLMDDACPFFASGTPIQFENLCKAFVDISNDRIEILKQQANHYHDQEFFQYNFVQHINDSAEELRNKYEVLMTRDRREFGGFYDSMSKTIVTGAKTKTHVNCQDYKVAHIAHNNVGLIFHEYPELRKQYSQSEYRIIMVKDMLTTLDVL